jgi:sulfatase modifying factor 1
MNPSIAIHHLKYMFLFLAFASTASGGQDAAAPIKPKTEGMVLIPAGAFTMGSQQEGSRANERPEHPVQMAAFWMDAKTVTNAQFAAFVEATGYKTTAELPIDWEKLKKSVQPGTPKPPDEMLRPGSLVFKGTAGPVDLREMNAWWQWVQGADWQHPEGPFSNIDGREHHPVVQVSWDDAAAYAEWAGKRLPTEAEWEYAARGGLQSTRYGWGAELVKDGKAMANTWTGKFPYENTATDGFAATAPVGSFPANGYGLHDMGGNIWNWCSDWYRPDTHVLLSREPSCKCPTGPSASLSAQHPHQTEERVTKGGSFLCHIDYCESYRPSARRGTPPDTGMSHIGFRCAKAVQPTTAP